LIVQLFIFTIIRAIYWLHCFTLTFRRWNFLLNLSTPCI
jgi:hypothetical protein